MPPTSEDENAKFRALIDDATFTRVESSSGSETSSSRQEQWTFSSDGRWWRHYEWIMTSPAGNVSSVEDNSGMWTVERVATDANGIGAVLEVTVDPGGTGEFHDGRVGVGFFEQGPVAIDYGSGPLEFYRSG